MLRRLLRQNLPCVTWAQEQKSDKEVCAAMERDEAAEESWRADCHYTQRRISHILPEADAATFLQPKFHSSFVSFAFVMFLRIYYLQLGNIGNRK